MKRRAIAPGVSLFSTQNTQPEAERLRGYLPGREFTAAFKTQVVLEFITGQKTVLEPIKPLLRAVCNSTQGFEQSS